ncbi:MAG: DUF2165 domain-containing protein [Kangiella sp.]|jgi:predicted small integral membrane protein|nr:DUF2165 domain-containing protein [Kangiella sp.]MCW9027407.1 DUF2165 domain-containing protein [Kangiella sp.]
MTIRHFKCLFVLLLALMCLFYAFQNIANIDACYQAIAYVLSMQEHAVYPDSIMPAIEASFLIWLVVILIIATEILAGLILLKGAWDLWSVRLADAMVFNQAKKYALIGAAIGIVVWFGYFAVFGGALMQMWQTQAGSMSLTGAFQYFASCVFIWLIVNSKDA